MPVSCTSSSSPLAVADLSAAVLAGGRSRRMGRDKALLRVADEPLIARAVRLLALLSDDVMVVADDPLRYRSYLTARLVADGGAGGEGPLVGVIAALAAARHPRLLVVATDLPGLSLPLLHLIATVAPEADAVVPESERGIEPLIACYHTRVLPVLRQQVADGQRSLVAAVGALAPVIVPHATVKQLDPAGLSFLNVNTPADWERFLAGFQDIL